MRRVTVVWPLQGVGVPPPTPWRGQTTTEGAEVHDHSSPYGLYLILNTWRKPKWTLRSQRRWSCTWDGKKQQTSGNIYETLLDWSGPKFSFFARRALCETIAAALCVPFPPWGLLRRFKPTPCCDNRQRGRRRCASLTFTLHCWRTGLLWDVHRTGSHSHHLLLHCWKPHNPNQRNTGSAFTGDRNSLPHVLHREKNATRRC